MCLREVEIKSINLRVVEIQLKSNIQNRTSYFRIEQFEGGWRCESHRKLAATH